MAPSRRVGLRPLPLLLALAVAPAAAETIFVPMPVPAPPGTFGGQSSSGPTRLVRGGDTAIVTWLVDPAGAAHVAAARSTDGATWNAVALPDHPGVGHDIATDGNGTWVLASTISVSGPADSDVHFTRSTDDGLTWSPPGLLGSGQPGDTLDDFQPAVAADATGRWVAVWLRGLDIVAARSSDGGASWSDPVTIGFGRNPRIATDGDGSWVTIYSNGVVSRSVDGGASWSAPATIGTANSTNASVAANEDGTFLASWDDDGLLQLRRSTDGGIGWQAVATPVLAGAGPQATANGAGIWGIVWSGTEPYDLLLPTRTLLMAWSSDDGASWSTPLPVDNAALAGAVAAGGVPIGYPDDRWLVAWGPSAARTIEAPTACTASPLPDCIAAAPKGARLKVRDHTPDTGDRLQYTWSRGEPTAFPLFGLPTIVTDYRLCLYDAGGLALDATAPADGTCEGRPCWKRSGATRLGYLHRGAAPDGIDKLSLQASKSATAKLVVVGKGADAIVPPLPVVPPLVVQVQAAHGSCWTSTMSTLSRNDAGQLKAEAD